MISVRLSGDAGNLSGSFEVNGGGFDATMKILGDDVIITTGGMEYALIRGHEYPKNPLSK